MSSFTCASISDSQALNEHVQILLIYFYTINGIGKATALTAAHVLLVLVNTTVLEKEHVTILTYHRPQLKHPSQPVAFINVTK